MIMDRLHLQWIDYYLNTADIRTSGNYCECELIHALAAAPIRMPFNVPLFPRASGERDKPSLVVWREAGVWPKLIRTSYYI